MPGGRLDTKVLTIDIQALGGLYIVKRHYFFFI
jgi:hypothetical protein